MRRRIARQHDGPGRDRAPVGWHEVAYLKQLMRDKWVEHGWYFVCHGEDLPELRGWARRP